MEVGIKSHIWKSAGANGVSEKPDGLLKEMNALMERSRQLIEQHVNSHRNLSAYVKNWKLFATGNTSKNKYPANRSIRCERKREAG
jgi:hypothetical protein